MLYIGRRVSIDWFLTGTFMNILLSDVLYGACVLYNISVDEGRKITDICDIGENQAKTL